jgi:Leucine Rich repeat
MRLGHPNLEKFAFVEVAAPDVEGEMDMIVSMLFVSAPKLTSLHFEKTKISWSSASAAAYCSGLKTLTLANAGFTDDDVISVASAISKCQSLVSVDLRGNNISDAGCLAASSILQKSTSLAAVLLDGAGVASRNSGLGPKPTKAAMERPTPRAA